VATVVDEVPSISSKGSSCVNKCKAAYVVTDNHGCGRTVKY
jgi:hypothetical protein